MGGSLGRAPAHAHHHHHGHLTELSGEVIRIHGNTYTFQKRLGVGGFGAVYSALASNGASVAIKVIKLDRHTGTASIIMSAYLNEIGHLNRLKRETRHVVRIYDFDFDPRSGRGYIVMELGGDNLAKLIERVRLTNLRNTGSGSYLDPVVKKGIWRQMVSIISTLTANGIVHMDLKPENLILFGQTLKIADLGISKKAEMRGRPGFGTLWFSAPEIMQDSSRHRKPYGPKADVWSLGAILYYMTYGSEPRYHSRAADPPRGRAAARDPLLNSILRRTLVLDPHARADINEVLRHPYTNN